MKPERIPHEGMQVNVRSKPWKGRCNKRCWNAKSKRCRCKCEGVYHGAASYGRRTRITEYIVGSEPAAPGRGQEKLKSKLK